jgi:hypothetical protein
MVHFPEDLRSRANGHSARSEEIIMKRLSLFAALFAFVVGGFQAIAQTAVYSDPVGQGTQDWYGNLALTFNVNTFITVDALGAYNASGTGAITGPIFVEIYDFTTSSVVASTVFTSGLYAPQGFDVFQSIAPVGLGPGSYEVDAVGFGPPDLNGNLNTGSSTGPLLNDLGGALTFTGAAWDYSTTLDQPTTCVICQPAPAQTHQFDAGTFEATVPEGGAGLLYLLIGGSACFGTMLLASRGRLPKLAAAA